MPPIYDNPAGRLHDVLTRLSAQKKQDSIIDGWAAVFDVAVDEVVLRLGGVANLVRELEEEVERLGVAPLPDLVSQYQRDWALPILPQSRAFNTPLGEVLPNPEALVGLAAVSALLTRDAPQGLVPEEEELEKIKGQVRATADAVQDAEDITAEMKSLLLQRLRGVEEAINQLDIGGPGAIRHATEALMGAAALEGTPGFWNTQTAKKVLAVAGIIWAGFSSGQEVQKNLNAWGEMLQLGPGIERPVDEASPIPDSGPPPASSSDKVEDDPP